MRHVRHSARRPRIRHAVALLVLLLVAAACTSEDSPAAESGARNTGTVDSFTVVGYQGADVLGGEEIAFDSLLGQGTPVVLKFWAPLCPPCRAEMPWFEASARRYEDSVLMVGLDIGPFIGLGTNEQGARLLEELDISYHYWLTIGGLLA